MTITVLLVPANLKVRKETLNSLIEGDAVSSEFVTFEVILEIRWSKPTPIDHGSFYRAVVFSGIRCRPNGGHQPQRLTEGSSRCRLHAELGRLFVRQPFSF